MELEADAPLPESEPLPSAARGRAELNRLSLLIAAGWLGTNLGLNVMDLPLQFVLMDQVGLAATGVSSFLAIGQFSNYVKPLAGTLTDSIPLCGTRRRHYLLWSLFGTGILWMALAFAPRHYRPMLAVYVLMYITVVFTSTTLGGVMVEVGNRFRAAGRLTAQRIAMFRVGTLGGKPLGGLLTALPLPVSAGVCAALHLVLVPFYYVYLPERPNAQPDYRALETAGRQFVGLFRNRILLSAAGMICLIAASPGFGTPLLFYQRKFLHFDGKMIGMLALVEAATGLAGAVLYHALCPRLNLRLLLCTSIVVHALGTLLFLNYHSWESALWISALAGITGTLAMLPVYDMAVRGTPRGSEALGYSVMMSVWNFTNAFSNVSGSWLYDHLHLSFKNLVWINAGTTALVLLAVPLLPKALLMSQDTTHAPDAAKAA